MSFLKLDSLANSEILHDYWMCLTGDRCTLHLSNSRLCQNTQRISISTPQSWVLFTIYVYIETRDGFVNMYYNNHLLHKGDIVSPHLLIACHRY